MTPVSDTFPLPPTPPPAEAGQEAENPRTIRWDDPTIAAHAETMPEDLREDFSYLARWIRDDCGRDLVRAQARIEKLGFRHDITVWSKIVRGRWQRDARGNPTPSPIMTAARLRKVVARIRADARLATAAGDIGFVVTPTSRLIMDYINSRRGHGRTNRWGVVVGRTGLQKTATYKHLAETNPGGVFWQESPATSSMGEFLDDLTVMFGGSKSLSTTDKKGFVGRALTERRTIILDNAQRLYLERARSGRQPAFDFLLKVQEQVGFTVILSITGDFERTMSDPTLLSSVYFEQIIGRVGGLHNFLRLEDQPSEEDCVVLAKAFGLVDARAHAETLHQIVYDQGRIRVLIDDLQAAKRQAEMDRRPLTIQDILDQRPEEPK